jgi:hypothetical protein
MTVTTESGGRQNAFPTETRPYIDESASYEGYPQNAEKVNGRWAMIGFVALLGAYATTGQIIPGIFLMDKNHSYWKYAEKVNGRLAMLGLVIGTVNYGLFGWIAPGIF